ncbi:MAG: aminoglycoside phosphotransferase family protein [Acidobacteriota bacterium]|nr:aminoglycoside phosphotransferase family protein [Acidobacteriota bacterium]
MVITKASRGPKMQLRDLVAEGGGSGAVLVSTLRRHSFSLLWFDTSIGRLILKVSRDEAADRVLQAEYDVLTSLPAWPGVQVPKAKASGSVNGRIATVMTAVEGTKLVLARQTSAEALIAVARACDQMASTASEATVDPVEIKRAILAAGNADAALADDAGVADLIAAAVRAHQGAGRRLRAAWTHNDFSGANVFARDVGVGVIDWALASRDGFAGLDRLMLAWHLWIKRDGVAPADAARRVTTRSLEGAGQWLMPDATTMPDADLRAAAVTMFAILGTRALVEGQRARLEAARAAIAGIQPAPDGPAISRGSRS